jgi:hypothetical protein
MWITKGLSDVITDHGGRGTVAMVVVLCSELMCAGIGEMHMRTSGMSASANSASIVMLESIIRSAKASKC